MGFKGKSISIASYDAGNRLTAWNRAGADENHSQTWNYDDAGNWNSTTKDGDTESRNHSVSNQITQLDGKAVSHDLKGNLTDYEYDRTDYRVKYDLDNRIVEVKADSETIRYRYDALGRRIVSKGDDETVLIWWGDSECAEYEHRASKDAIQNDIMGHPTRLNSVIARDTEDRENRVELQWYHKNYLDHVYAVSDDNGNLVEHYRYTAFGEAEIYSATGARRNTSAIANTVMWNTRRYDADNGLYYYKYRHYASNIGRWLGRDPIEEDGGINLYAFVGNRALNAWDMYGLEKKCCYPEDGYGPPQMYDTDTHCCEKGEAVKKDVDDALRKCCPSEIIIIELRFRNMFRNNKTDVGHCFVSTPNKSHGFYPHKGESIVNNVGSLNGWGEIKDDSKTNFDDSYKYRACPKSVEILDQLLETPGISGSYNLLNIAGKFGARNCCGWACEQIDGAGFTAPYDPSTPRLTPAPVGTEPGYAPGRNPVQ